MFLKNRQRRVPELNTTSTADISFMLLILFLVTTSMDIDKGLSRQLPPPTPPEEQMNEREVPRENILNIHILADNKVNVNEENEEISKLKKRIMKFVEQKRNVHIIRIDADRNSNYDTYFKVQNQIVGAYANLRNNYAKQKFGKSFALCSEDEKQAVRDYFPQRISETYSSEEGGEK